MIVIVEKNLRDFEYNADLGMRREDLKWNIGKMVRKKEM